MAENQVLGGGALMIDLEGLARALEAARDPSQGPAEDRATLERIRAAVAAIAHDWAQADFEQARGTPEVERERDA